MPDNAMYVGRPTDWGNPYVVGKLSEDSLYPVTAEQAVAFYRKNIVEKHNQSYLIKLTLKGYDLACWCPLDQPCHADVLLEIANS